MQSRLEKPSTVGGLNVRTSFRTGLLVGSYFLCLQKRLEVTPFTPWSINQGRPPGSDVVPQNLGGLVLASSDENGDASGYCSILSLVILINMVIVHDIPQTIMTE